MTYTRCRINTTDSPDDENKGARNMYRIGTNIYEKRTVRQVGYLQEINQLFQMLYRQERHYKEKTVKHETCVNFTLVTKFSLYRTSTVYTCQHDRLICCHNIDRIYTDVHIKAYK